MQTTHKSSKKKPNPTRHKQINQSKKKAHSIHQLQTKPSPPIAAARRQTEHRHHHTGDQCELTNLHSKPLEADDQHVGAAHLQLALVTEHVELPAVEALVQALGLLGLHVDVPFAVARCFRCCHPPPFFL